MEFYSIIDTSAFIWDYNQFKANSTPYYVLAGQLTTLIETIDRENPRILMREELVNEMLIKFPWDLIDGSSEFSDLSNVVYPFLANLSHRIVTFNGVITKGLKSEPNIVYHYYSAKVKQEVKFLINKMHDEKEESIYFTFLQIWVDDKTQLVTNNGIQPPKVYKTVIHSNREFQVFFDSFKPIFQHNRKHDHLIRKADKDRGYKLVDNEEIYQLSCYNPHDNSIAQSLLSTAIPSPIEPGKLFNYDEGNKTFVCFVATGGNGNIYHGYDQPLGRIHPDVKNTSLKSNMSDNYIPSIGKNVIETLTIGMYDAPYFIYREYIQNAADSIDSAVRAKVLKNRASGEIKITIDELNHKIIIEDNGIGIENKSVPSLLGNVAQSTKNRYIDKGFRGIGRLGGLGYCDTLTYETSFKGERFKSIMIWDAKNLREILNNPNLKIDATQVISAITKYSKGDENQESHYFKITLEGVVNMELLDLKKVNDYLCMVAPIPFNSSFSFSTTIYERAKADKIQIDEYKIFVNGNQIFKGYKNIIYKEYKSKNKQPINKIFDEVYSVEFFEEFFDKEPLFWGWYGVTKNMHHIPDENNEKFIRLRKANIQVGLGSRLDEFHKKESGNKYFIGEVYAVHQELHPNARRDFFIENSFSNSFLKKLKSVFNVLNDLFYDFSKKNSAFKTIDKLENEILPIQSDDAEQKINKAKETLAELYFKYEGGALAKIITEKFPLKEIKKHSTSIKAVQSKGAKPVLALKLGENENDLLSLVFEVIRGSETKSNAANLIAKIQAKIEARFPN